MARGFARGAKSVQLTVQSLSENCATWLAEGLQRLADNDLTYEITPVTPLIERYSADEIGQTAQLTNALRNKFLAAIEAYNSARLGLSGTITEVKEASDAVTRTSEQLNTAATRPAPPRSRSRPRSSRSRPGPPTRRGPGPRRRAP